MRRLAFVVNWIPFRTTWREFDPWSKCRVQQFRIELTRLCDAYRAVSISSKLNKNVLDTLIPQLFFHIVKLKSSQGDFTATSIKKTHCFQGVFHLQCENYYSDVSRFFFPHYFTPKLMKQVISQKKIIFQKKNPTLRKWTKSLCNASSSSSFQLSCCQVLSQGI